MADKAMPSSLLVRMAQHLEQHGLKREGTLLLWLVALLFRWLVGLHSYSGASTPPMFGDYEAQRHWMEITLNLPVSDWYFNTTENNLLYWGLDYPPLTAYVSYAFGAVARVMEPQLVALRASHGFESPTSKVFMRASVLACDVLLFIPVILWLVRRMGRAQSWSQKTMTAAVILLQPALLLIDHGHFQVRSVESTEIIKSLTVVHCLKPVQQRLPRLHSPGDRAAVERPRVSGEHRVLAGTQLQANGAVLCAGRRCLPAVQVYLPCQHGSARGQARCGRATHFWRAVDSLLCISARRRIMLLISGARYA
jgi:hypothetical protein